MIIMVTSTHSEHQCKSRVAELLDFDFLGDSRRFSRRFFTKTYEIFTKIYEIFTKIYEIFNFNNIDNVECEAIK